MPTAVCSCQQSRSTIKGAAIEIPANRIASTAFPKSSTSVLPMASQLVASQAITEATPGALQRLIRLCVRRRVPISMGLFGGLILLDLAVLHTRPHDLLNLQSPFVIAGLVLIALVLLVRSWAAGTLRKQKELATSGPYACVRHPLYFGSFLMMVGFGTLIHDPITLWVVAGPIAWIYWQAIRSEERHIAGLFPAQWPHYAAKVPRFLPRRLTLPKLSDWSLTQWVRNSEYQALLGSTLALICIQIWHAWR
jgi:protein-S-isoprenylcysteine O-methyltransferase Ste14